MMGPSCLRLALEDGSSSESEGSFFTHPTICVLEPHDIVLAQIRARLHLDEFQRDLSQVAQPVGCAEGNIRGLIFAKHDLLVAVGNQGGSPDDNPMFSTMMVHLK